MRILTQIEMDLGTADNLQRVYINVADNSLSVKWVQALTHLIANNYHLEKNYCWFGFPNGPRNGELLINQINANIQAINSAELGYTINDHFTLENSLVPGPVVDGAHGGEVDHAHFNQLHRYFEDLQGTSGNLSPYYARANARTRWHIRQLNLLCHEFESWALSRKKSIVAPEWRRPSQLMCWINAPRFSLEESDFELFGIETINRPLGGVFVGVNKAVGKHHWEVFNDEAEKNPDYIAHNLVTTVLRPQCEAAGDFDIEWARNPAEYHWQKKHLADFRSWLINNGFDPENKHLTIGHPQVGQVDLIKSFGTDNYQDIWAQLEQRLNVYRIKISGVSAEYNYNWNDADFIDLQVSRIQQGN